MFTIIPQSERKAYTYDELKSHFNGKWVFLIHAELTPGLSTVKGTPVVIADTAYEGTGTGIYNDFETGEYGELTTEDFTDVSGDISSLLWEVRG